MSISRAAAVGVALCVVLLQFWVVPANAAWRDGACRPGEGQTVIVDWSAAPEAGAGTELVRCIALDGSGYPDPGSMDGMDAPLRSADIAYAPTSPLSDVNGIPTPPEHYWHYTKGEDGGWLGRGHWLPEPTVDTFVGITLTEVGMDRTPVRIPRLEAAEDPSPSPEPSGEPSGPGGTDEPSEGTGESEEPSEPGGAEEPTEQPGPGTPPTTEPTTTPTASADPSPQSQPPTGNQPETPAPAPRVPPRPTTDPSAPDTPTPDPTPSDTPSQLPPATPFEDPEVEEAGPPIDAPSATPTPVWGREDTDREPTETFVGSEDPSASWLTAALAVVVLGGLGTAAGMGLRSSATPPLEDE